MLLNRATYRRRSCVERSVGRLKDFRRVGTSYEKLPESQLAVVHVAAIRIYSFSQGSWLNTASLGRQCPIRRFNSGTSLADLAAARKTDWNRPVVEAKS
ncbi:MAG TPA: transposase [Gemmataceae bacterium]|jgi:hypothetical protein|nr:transposase [Gemmataceae bacterium]